MQLPATVLRERLFGEILQSYLKDTEKTRILNQNGSHSRAYQASKSNNGTNGTRFSAQDFLWTVTSSYDLSVYGPNGFVRFFKGSIGSGAAALDVCTKYKKADCGSIRWSIANVGSTQAEVSVLDAYTGNGVIRLLRPEEKFEKELSLQQFFGWYDLIVTVAGDPTFNYRLAVTLKPEGTASQTQLLGDS